MASKFLSYRRTVQHSLERKYEWPREEAQLWVFLNKETLRMTYESNLNPYLVALEVHNAVKGRRSAT
jgi:hypothetical protein